MDYFPSPVDPLPELNVPLLDVLPLEARTAASGASVGQVVGTTGPQPEQAKTLTTSWGEAFYVSREQEDDEAFRTNVTEQWLEFARHHQLIADAVSGEETYINRMLAQPLERLASLLQSWAFFGLIELRSGRRVVPQEWMRRISPADSPVAVQWPSDYLRYFMTDTPWPHEAAAAISRVQDVCSHLEDSPLAILSPLADVLLSIRLLCETFQRPDDSNSSRRGSRHLTKLLLGRGWCPSTVHRVIEWPQRGLSLAYYIFRMRSRRNGKVFHALCTPQTCKAHDTSLGGMQENCGAAGTLPPRYRTRHVHDHCACSTIVVDTQQICEVITNGKIPLIQLSVDRGEVKATVTEARLLDEYFAISHVWSDGLGNPDQNALPQCQLRRIWEQIERLPNFTYRDNNIEVARMARIWTLLPGFLRVDAESRQILRPRRTKNVSVLLWMDTLCIPVGEGSAVKKCKNQAIGRMNLVYAAASQILVLDAELMAARVSTSSLLEVHARIAVSPWMRRSWTYQEGALARRCHFQCADSSILPELSNKFQKSFERDEREFHRLVSEKFLGRRVPIVLKIFAAIRSQKPPKVDGQNGDYEHGDARNRVEEELFNGYWSILTKSLRGKFEHYAQSKRIPEWPQLVTFVTAWNELAHRSSSFVDDVYLIFANMLDINPMALLRYEERESRMQALVWNMRILPLAMLYNHGPRIGPHRNHRNRWVPSGPSRTPLPGMEDIALVSDHPEIMRLYAGSLWIQAETAHKTMLMIVDTSYSRAKRLYVEHERGVWLKIDAIVPENDGLQTTAAYSMCFMMETHNKGRSDRAGARLCLIEGEDASSGNSTTNLKWKGLPTTYFYGERALDSETTSLIAIYDCPLVITEIDRAECIPEDGIKISWDEVNGRTLKYPNTAWKLEIKCENFSDFAPLIPRPSVYANSGYEGIVFTWGIPVAILPVLWWLVAFPLRIVIAVRIGWHGTSNLYKASTIGFVWFPFGIAEALFIADRSYQNVVQPIDIAYVTVSMIVVFLHRLSMWCTIYFASTQAYTARMRSFDDDWPASASSWQHRLTFGMGEFGASYLNLFNIWEERPPTASHRLAHRYLPKMLVYLIFGSSAHLELEEEEAKK